MAAALSPLSMDEVYVPAAGRYRVEVGCSELVEMNGGSRPCGSMVVNAVTGLCDARDEHADLASIARMRDNADGHAAGHAGPRRSSSPRTPSTASRRCWRSGCCRRSRGATGDAHTHRQIRRRGERHAPRDLHQLPVRHQRPRRARAGRHNLPSCWAGKLRTDRPMPWDEPERLAFYGVDPDAHGNRERYGKTVEVDADGDLTVTGYWR